MAQWKQIADEVYNRSLLPLLDFAYKGFGALILEASLNNDIALLEACAMVAVCVAVTTQTLADIGYTFLNPRIRFS